MAVTRVVLNRRSLSAILRGKEGRLTADLERRGDRVVAAAGSGHERQTYVGRNRVRVTVRETEPSSTRNDQQLLGALSSARG